MQRIHDRGNIGKLILDVEKTPTPLVSPKERHLFAAAGEGFQGQAHVGCRRAFCSQLSQLSAGAGGGDPR